MNFDPDAFAQWEDKLGVRRTAVLAMTVWMTWRAFTWAGEFAYAMKGTDALATAAIIAAVTAPISLLQAAVFKAYLDAKGAP